MRTRREGTLALGRAISLIAVAWCAISACGGTVEKSKRDGELGGSGGSGEVPPVGGVSGNGGGTVAVGGVGGSLGTGGAGGSSGAGTGGMGSGGSIACGRAFCRPAQVPPSIPPFPACCPQPGPADPPGSSCGIDVSAFGILGYRFETSLPAAEPARVPRSGMSRHRALFAGDHTFATGGLLPHGSRSLWLSTGRGGWGRDEPRLRQRDAFHFHPADPVWNIHSPEPRFVHLRQ